MPLIALWSSNPVAVSEFSIEQVVATAGDGNLRDDTPCSRELREYLSQVDSEKLSRYVEHCLSTSFAKGGMVLQDLINELGRRLDYKVVNGRYQGTSKNIGFDGIWATAEGNSIVVEVKTTDAYRISLDTIASYRDRLIESQQLTGKPSILIVVGRGETGELEAQVRGSRHAWDIRLISTDSLIKLVQIKENAEGIETGTKIRSLLIPMEYTRLDPMVDVMFAAAKDVEAASELPADDEEELTSQVDGTTGRSRGVWSFTEYSLIQKKRDAILSAISIREGVGLIKRTRALYWSSDHGARVACTISKRYTKRSSYPYWYAYHPHWDEFLKEGDRAFLALGCMDLDTAFAIPRNVITSVLDHLNVTEKKDTDELYWHIHIVEPKPGNYALLLPKKGETLPLLEYQIECGQGARAA